MHITIRNLTVEPITAHAYPAPSIRLISRHAEKSSPMIDQFTLPPSLDIIKVLPKGFKKELTLLQPLSLRFETSTRESMPLLETSPLLDAGDAKEWSNPPNCLKVRFSMKFSSSWRTVAVPADCPWRIFTRRVTQRHYRLLILTRRNLASFLSELPDRLPLSSLALPGTHDTMAFYGWPISQCQSPTTPLTSQLHSGVRVIDIRLAVIPPPPPTLTPLDATRTRELIAFHGLWPQRTPFTSILSDIHAFLTSPIGQTETIIMSIKQEDFAITPAPFFSQLVRDTIARGPGGWDNSKPSFEGINKGMWFLENRIPTLGEVRSKVVMLSRFGGNGAGWQGGLEGMGIHPTTWPDSVKEGFEWELKGTLVRTSDWYAIPSFFSIPEKVDLATANLVPPSHAKQPVLPITYFSAATFPLALPSVVAKGFGWPKSGLGIEGVNSRLGAWLIDQLNGRPESCNRSNVITRRNTGKLEKEMEASADPSEPRIRGFALLDYYSEPEGGDIVPLLVECNFRGRKAGEEGW